MFVLDIPTLLLYYMDHRCGVRARVGRRRACALTWLPPGSKSDPRAPVPRPVCKCKVHVVGNLRLYTVTIYLWTVRLITSKAWVDGHTVRRKTNKDALTSDKVHLGKSHRPKQASEKRMAA